MKWYQAAFRRSLVDMHVEEWSDEFLAEFSPREYVEQLRRAGFQSATVYMNSHVGYAYWPTALPLSHAHRCLHGRDAMGELVRFCREAGISVVAYYTLVFNNWAYGSQPSWRMVDAEGRASRDRVVGGTSGRDLGTGGRYGLVCPNNPDYRAFVEAEISEFSGLYDYDGIMIDMTFWPFICHCPACVRRWREEGGAEGGPRIPRAVDWGSPAWRRFQAARERWLVEFGASVTATVRRAKPLASVEHNFSSATAPWDRGVTEAIAPLSDYPGGDLYGGFREQSFACKLYHGIAAPGVPFEYMTSRCHPNLREHTALKRAEEIEAHACLTLAHHGALMLIDAIDPRGTLNPRVYDVVRSVFNRTRPYDPYLSVGTMRRDVAVYFGMRSKFDPGSTVAEPVVPRDRVPHLDACLGACAGLREAHLPHGVVTSRGLGDLQGVRLLVLPEVLVMDDAEVDAIASWVRAGGSAYLGGRTAPALARALLGLDVDGTIPQEVSYVSPTGAGTRFFEGVSRAWPLSAPSRQARLPRVPPGVDVLATITVPYTDPSDFGRFASIHSNPPGRDTGLPALVSGRCGKGRVTWSATALEAGTSEAHRRAFAAIVRDACAGQFSFGLRGPSAAEVVMFDDPAGRRSLVSIVNLQEDMPPLPLHDLELRVGLFGRTAKAVRLLPGREDAAHRVEAGQLLVPVARLDLIAMYELSWA